MSQNIARDLPEHKESDLTDLSPLNIIRTETVLSRLPIHNLSKKGRVNIQITKKNKYGEIDLRWEVSYNDRYGQPRQLAYKLDTIVINQKTDELGRPLPKLVRLGSLMHICGLLGLVDGGRQNPILRKPFIKMLGRILSRNSIIEASMVPSKFSKLALPATALSLLASDSQMAKPLMPYISS